MERDCESELSKLNIEQNACIYHFGASVIHGQRSNILRLLPYGSLLLSMLEGHVYLPVAICVVLVSILVIAIFHKKICSRVLCIY